MSTTRRDFVRFTGLALAAATYQSSLFAAATKSDVSPLLSVGYAPALPATSGRLSPAPHSSYFGGSARITIRGGARADKYAKQQGGIAVDAVYPNGKSVLFSSATKFSTPALAVIVLPAPTFTVRDLGAKTEAALTLGRAGVYVIAVREGASDAAPDWNRLELVRDGNRFKVPGAGVSYTILTVE